MKVAMTNFDINAIITELSQRLSKSELKNIFELNDIFFFKFRTKTEGTQFLVVEPGKRIHLTKYKRDFPPSPSGLCKVFRQHIKGKWLQSIEQYDFDRICVLKFEAYEKVYTLIIELFSKGNIILLSPEGKILVAKNYKKMRDRDIHPGIEFKFPPSSGQNFLKADLDWIQQQFSERKEKDILTLISKTLNINKLYAQEICLLAEVDPKLAGEELPEEVVQKLLTGITKLREKMKSLAPVKVVHGETNELIDIIPFSLKVYAQYKEEPFDSFSEALDFYFSTMDSEKESKVELSAEVKRIKHLQEVKRKQVEHIEEMTWQAKKEKEKGNAIYLYLNEVDELLSTITNARRKNVPWTEIKEKLAKAAKENRKGARLLKKINEKNKTVVLTLDGKDIVVDFLKSASENANNFYLRAKKAESKIPGAQKKVQELTEQIKKLELGLETLAKKERILIEKRKREWYEKFHWFRSSDGFLVIAGKDQRTNVDLTKKYLEKGDLFLHADIHGAAVVIIKGEGKTIPQSTIDEAAIFSVSYSKAWKDRLSTADTYWVTPEQVSFSAPSGEYLAKGSFIIKGKKTILKNIPLEIAVAPVIEEKWAYVLAGPLAALKANPKILREKIITVIPGDILKSKIAKKIVNRFLEGLSDSDRAKVAAVALNELISHLPGDCFIKNELDKK